MNIYIASKTKHAPKWISLREDLSKNGIYVISSWIDEHIPGQTKNWTDLWSRIISEIKESKFLLFYAEEEEIQKGSLVEVGIALAFGVPIYWIGPETSSIPKTNFVKKFNDMHDAVQELISYREVEKLLDETAKNLYPLCNGVRF